MVRNAVVQIEAAEPAIGEVQVDLFTELPLGSDAEAIPNQKHPDQQFRIDRGAARVAV